MSTSSWNEKEEARELAIAKKKNEIAMDVVNEADQKILPKFKAATAKVKKPVDNLEFLIHAFKELQNQAKKGSLSDTMINYLKKHKFLSSDAAKSKVFKFINSGKANQLIGKLNGIKNAATMTLENIERVTSCFDAGVKGARLILDIRKAALNNVNAKRNLAESRREMKEAYRSMKNVMGLVRDVKNIIRSISPMWVLLGTYIDYLDTTFGAFKKAVDIMDKYAEKIEKELNAFEKLRKALEARDSMYKNTRRPDLDSWDPKIRGKRDLNW